MTKEEQFEILKTTIKNFLIDNKHFDTKEQAEKYVEEDLPGDIKALIKDDKEDFKLNLFSLDTTGEFQIFKTINIRKFNKE